MFDELVNKAFRDAFVEENLTTGIAFQIRALRERAQLNQSELGRLANKATSVISRLENPDYGRYTIRTLLDLATALDVALLVKFVSFPKLLEEIADLSPEALAVESYTQSADRRAQALTELTATQAPEITRGGAALSAYTSPPNGNGPVPANARAHRNRNQSENIPASLLQMSMQPTQYAGVRP